MIERVLNHWRKSVEAWKKYIYKPSVWQSRKVRILKRAEGDGDDSMLKVTILNRVK